MPLMALQIVFIPFNSASPDGETFHFFGASVGIHIPCPDEPGVPQSSFLLFLMTDSFLTDIDGTSEDVMDPAEVEVPNPGASYDPIGNVELDELRKELNSRRWDESWISQIRAAAGKKSFPLHLQFEPVDAEKAFTLSLGELAASAQNETGIQYIYPKRVKHVLLGTHGIAKGFKLSNEIQVCYKRDLAGELDPHFVISSGRHRLTAIILLLQHLGIKWEKQRIIVSTKVVSDTREFKQVIMDANDARKMKGAETRNHKLGARGVETHDVDRFYATVRLSRKPECPAAFAAACRFVAADKPREFQDRLYTYTAGGFGQAMRVDRDNSCALMELVKGEGRADDLKSLAESITGQFISLIAKGREQFPEKYENISAPRAVAQAICVELKLIAPTYS